MSNISLEIHLRSYPVSISLHFNTFTWIPMDSADSHLLLPSTSWFSSFWRSIDGGTFTLPLLRLAQRLHVAYLHYLQEVKLRWILDQELNYSRIFTSFHMFSTSSYCGPGMFRQHSAVVCGFSTWAPLPGCRPPGGSERLPGGFRQHWEVGIGHHWAKSFNNQISCYNMFKLHRGTAEKKLSRLESALCVLRCMVIHVARHSTKTYYCPISSHKSIQKKVCKFNPLTNQPISTRTKASPSSIQECQTSIYIYIHIYI